MFVTLGLQGSRVTGTHRGAEDFAQARLLLEDSELHPSPVIIGGAASEIKGCAAVDRPVCHPAAAITKAGPIVVRYTSSP